MWLAAGLFAIVIALLAGCGSSHGVSEADGGMRRIDSGAVPAIDAGGAGLDAGPATRRPPPRPDVEDAPSMPEAAYLLRDLRWDQGEGWRTTGFDLDGLVTVEPSPMVECVAPAASATPELDGEDGIDNALGHQIAPLLLLVLPDIDTGARESQAEGVGALLVRLRDYNGGADDPAVTADVFVTAGFDASGAVLVDEEDVLGGDLEAPRLRADTAYVAGGVLVARLPERAPLRLAYGTSVGTVRLTDATLTVDLDGSATLSGRWPILDILGDAPDLGICTPDTEHRMLNRVLDLVADLRAVPGTGGPGAVCDAISAALPFERVEPATIAGAATMPALTPYCP